MKKIELTDNQKVWFFEIILILLISMVSFLNFQMDDERYYDIYKFEEAAEESDYTNGVLTIHEGSSLKEDALICKMPAIHLGKGSYLLELDHQGDVDFKAELKDGDEVIETWGIPASETLTKIPFSLNDDRYNLVIDYLYPGSGTVTIKHAYLRADFCFWTDSIYFGIVLILSVLFIGHWIRKNDFLSKPFSEQWIPVALLLFFIFINYPYYSNIFVTGKDMNFHLARVEGIVHELRAGQFPVQLYTQANEGRGMIGCMYPSVFFYIPAFLRLLGVSLPTAFKAMTGLMNLGTMISAWYSAKHFTKKNTVLLLTTLVYSTMSYRIFCLYTREVIGEALSLVFVPLIIAGLYEIILGNKKYWWMLALGMSGVIASHVLSTLMWAAACAFFCAVYIVRIFKEKRILSLLLAAVSCLAMSLFTLVPFVYYYFSDIDTKTTLAVRDFSNMAIFPTQLFMVTDGYWWGTKGRATGYYQEGSLSIGITGIICLVIGILFILCKKEKDTTERFLLLMYVTGAAALFMATTWFPWQTLQKFSMINRVISMFQFPIRFQQIAEPMIIFSGTAMCVRIPEISKYRKALMIALVSGGIFCSLIAIDSVCTDKEAFITEFSADTGDHYPPDYVPAGYNEDGFLETAEGENANVSDYKKSDSNVSFTYTASGDTDILVPVTFYKGYHAYLTLADGSAREAEIAVGDSGMTKIMAPAGENVKVLLRYEQPVVFYIATAIALLSSLALFIWIVLKQQMGIIRIGNKNGSKDINNNSGI